MIKYTPVSLFRCLNINKHKPYKHNIIKYYYCHRPRLDLILDIRKYNIYAGKRHAIVTIVSHAVSRDRSCTGTRILCTRCAEYSSTEYRAIREFLSLRNSYLFIFFGGQKKKMKMRLTRGKRKIIGVRTGSVHRLF